MLLLETLAHGLHAPDAALALNRAAVGAFFALSGYNKLFNAGRHASLRASLEKNRIPLIGFNEWFVPSVEFSAGITLALGFLTAGSAFLLLVICAVACICEAAEKVAAYSPINAADKVDDYLYLPEVLYIFMLAVNILAGTGAYSVDALLF